MKSWKFMLSSALTVAGLAMYQTTVFSNHVDIINKITMEPETGDLSLMEDVVLSGTEINNESFTFLNHQLKTTGNINLFKRSDLRLAQGDPDLEKILENNPDFFRSTNEYSLYLVDEQYALNFYTIYNRQTANVFANVYNQKTKKVDTIDFSFPNTSFLEVLDVYIEGDEAFVAMSARRQNTKNNHFDFDFIIQKIHLTTMEKQIILEESVDDYSVYPEYSIHFSENSPYLLLHQDAHNDGSYNVLLIDLRTGTTLFTEEYDHQVNAPYYYMRDKENIYRLEAEGSAEKINIRVEQAEFTGSTAEFVERSTLEEVPFDLDESMMPVDFFYEENPFGYGDTLLDYLFNTYTSTVIEGKLYMVPSFLGDQEKEGSLFYIFDLATGKLEASARLKIDTKNPNADLRMMQLKKVLPNY